MRTDILADVIGRSLGGRPALLKGARRLRVRNEVYPALVPGEAEVRGILYEQLTPEDCIALDRFEGPEYNRRTITVLVEGALVEAETYFASAAGQELLEETEWAPELLSENGVQKFRASYKGLADPFV